MCVCVGAVGAVVPVVVNAFGAVGAVVVVGAFVVGICFKDFVFWGEFQFSQKSMYFSFVSKSCLNRFTGVNKTAHGNIFEPGGLMVKV